MGHELHCCYLLACMQTKHIKPKPKAFSQVGINGCHKSIFVTHHYTDTELTFSLSVCSKLQQESVVPLGLALDQVHFV